MSGPYGRIYKHLRTHPKWCGGLHGDVNLKRLSWPAKGLWAELVSLSVGRAGKFSRDDLDNFKGVKDEWLDELVANGLVDREGELYRLHDFDKHAMTPERWETTKKLAADRQAKKRAAVTQEVTSDVTHENGVSHAQVTRDITREFLPLSLRSDQEESDARANVPSDFVGVRPAVTPKLGPWVSELFNAYHAHWRDRGVPGPDSNASRPEHPMWRTLAEYMVKRGALRGWPEDLETRRAKSAALIRGFYASTDPRTVQAGHPLSFLVSRPGNYTGDRKAA